MRQNIKTQIRELRTLLKSSNIFNTTSRDYFSDSEIDLIIKAIQKHKDDGVYSICSTLRLKLEEGNAFIIQND